METAHLEAGAETDPNVALASAADAFKVATSTGPARAENGQFAAKEPEPEQAEELLVDDEAPEEAVEEEDEQEAATEAQPMPPSWPADQAEQWNELPPETQSYLARREGEREAAVQAKFQESANVRKAAEAAQMEANSNRSQYAQALDVVMAAIQGERPDPRAYGAGTGQYDRESYDLAVLQHEQNQALFAQLHEQREGITAQEKQEAEQSFTAWKAEVEAQFAPKLLADLPELTDPERLSRGIVCPGEPEPDHLAGNPCAVEGQEVRRATFRQGGNQAEACKSGSPSGRIQSPFRTEECAEEQGVRQVGP